jgi:hypothetical protein
LLNILEFIRNRSQQFNPHRDQNIIQRKRNLGQIAQFPQRRAIEMTSKSRTRNCGTVIDPSHSNKENIDPSKIEVFGGNHLKQSFICTSKS